MVLSVDRTRSTMTVSHRPIDGFMPAMTMPFQVKDARELNSLSPGTRVQFILAVSGKSSNARSVRAIVPRIEDLKLPQVKKPHIGEPAPDFALVNQQNRPVRLSSLRGRIVVIDFIYTRCPLPDVCPRLSANFAYLARRVPEVALLSITLDPEWDRPEVLAEYARRWQADPAKWHFLTGPAEDVRKVATWFGLLYWPEDGAITHTVSTAVLDRQGRLTALIEGSSFRPGQLVDLVNSMIGAHASTPP
jgi:protein SCO1/2